MAKLTKEQKEVNAFFFKDIIKMLDEGGIWIWPDTGFMYTKKNGKLVGETPEADKAYKELI
jgi:hypothetical protein